MTQAQKESWANWGKALLATALIALPAFLPAKASDKVATGIGFAGQTGLLNATASLFDSAVDANPMQHVTDEIVAKNQIIDGLKSENDALKKQLGQLSTQMATLMQEVSKLTNK